MMLMAVITVIALGASIPLIGVCSGVVNAASGTSPEG
jgi:hypothetical protein